MGFGFRSIWHVVDLWKILILASVNITFSIGPQHAILTSTQTHNCIMYDLEISKSLTLCPLVFRRFVIFWYFENFWLFKKFGKFIIFEQFWMFRQFRIFWKFLTTWNYQTIWNYMTIWIFGQFRNNEQFQMLMQNKFEILIFFLTLWNHHYEFYDNSVISDDTEF